ncbi:atrophin-1 [Eupeodes corollae]|uniref:atrophin-1 n=1 Tax=Eupeodes corollae TaxID=290404 RepID=UPI0024936A6C|nr:atrophin-1 [Eupeodes corollae]
MIRLFVLCLMMSTYVYAASNPEIATKSGKSQLSAAASSNQKSVSQHDDPLLNSINAYAQQFESSSVPGKSYGLTTQLYSQPYAIQQPQQYQPQTSFRVPQALPQHLPSSPALETNFQPMPPAPQHQHPHHHHQHQHQHQQLQLQPQPQPHIQAHQQSPPTPVLMQYLPQSQVNDGVQYLQLIPTRPLIVPISPYMSPMAQQAYHAPQIIPPPHQLNDFVAGRSQISPNEPDAASNIPYGLQAYANTLQNYRSYRFNRDVTPVGMILNMQEYMPSPNDAPKTKAVKGRP